MQIRNIKAHMSRGRFAIRSAAEKSRAAAELAGNPSSTRLRLRPSEPDGEEMWERRDHQPALHEPG